MLQRSAKYNTHTKDNELQIARIVISIYPGWTSIDKS